MPNWCSNQVLIKGEKSKVEELKNKLVDLKNKTLFDFNAVIKCPQVLLESTAPERNEQRAAVLQKKYGAKDWYDWCNLNWGTKWNSSDSHIFAEEPDGDFLTVGYSFETAWAPPIPVIELLAEQNPDLEIYICFDESGMDFAGWKYYKDGELCNEQEYDSYYSIKAHMEPDPGFLWDMLS